MWAVAGGPAPDEVHAPHDLVRGDHAVDGLAVVVDTRWKGGAEALCLRRARRMTSDSVGVAGCSLQHPLQGSQLVHLAHQGAIARSAPHRDCQAELPQLVGIWGRDRLRLCWSAG